MWEQYGENHGGVCLLFDRARLTERIVASLRGQGLASPYYRRVSYTPEGPGAGATLDAGALVGKVSGDSVARYVEGHHDELFLLKADDWATEFEYRFVVTTPEVEFLFVDYADALDAVVVGEAFPNRQRPAALHSCTSLDADAMLVVWSMGRPALVSLGA